MENQVPDSNGAPKPHTTPFDNPFFLPVLLGVFAVWFGYDGWFNPEMEWLKFNRVGFVVSLAGTLYYGNAALRRRKKAADK